MKLFLIVMVWGHVGITIGPLPDSMPNCLSLAAERVVALDKSFSERAVFPQNGKLIWRSDVSIACGYFNERPAGGATLDPATLELPR
jgi:hypothetical protein